GRPGIQKGVAGTAQGRVKGSRIAACAEHRDHDRPGVDAGLLQVREEADGEVSGSGFMVKQADLWLEQILLPPLRFVVARAYLFCRPLRLTFSYPAAIRRCIESVQPLDRSLEAVKGLMGERVH